MTALTVDVEMDLEALLDLEEVEQCRGLLMTPALPSGWRECERPAAWTIRAWCGAGHASAQVFCQQCTDDWHQPRTLLMCRVCTPTKSYYKPRYSFVATPLRRGSGGGS